MGTGSLSAALKKAVERNVAAAEIYRSIARKSEERWLAGMAAAWREQRENLSRELAGIALSEADASPSQIELPPDLDPALVFSPGNLRRTVEAMKALELDDLALFKAMAQARWQNPTRAQQFETIASSAKLRIGIADSHLDLLSLG